MMMMTMMMLYMFLFSPQTKPIHGSITAQQLCSIDNPELLSTAFNPVTANCRIYPAFAIYCSRHITEISGDMRVACIVAWRYEYFVYGVIISSIARCCRGVDLATPTKPPVCYYSQNWLWHREFLGAGG